MLQLRLLFSNTGEKRNLSLTRQMPSVSTRGAKRKTGRLPNIVGMFPEALWRELFIQLSERKRAPLSSVV